MIDGCFSVNRFCPAAALTHALDLVLLMAPFIPQSKTMLVRQLEAKVSFDTVALAGNPTDSLWLSA